MALRLPTTAAQLNRQVRHPMSLFGRRFLVWANFVIFVRLLSGQAAFCDSAPIVDIDPSTQVPGQYWGFHEEHGNGMVGWTFNLQQALTVTAVGWYDDGRDGLSRAFQVGLWQDLTGYFEPGTTATQLLGNPATGISIPGGTTASLQGSWRIVPLSIPVNLLPGNYELGGLDTATTADIIEYVQVGSGQPIPPVSADLTIRQFFYAFGAGPTTFQMVDNRHFYLADGLELGPMLFTGVPEPSTSALLCLAAAALITGRRRR
jgi:hypothetical protein